MITIIYRDRNVESDGSHIANMHLEVEHAADVVINETGDLIVRIKGQITPICFAHGEWMAVI